MKNKDYNRACEIKTDLEQIQVSIDIIKKSDYQTISLGVMSEYTSKMFVSALLKIQKEMKKEFKAL